MKTIIKVAKPNHNKKNHIKQNNKKKKIKNNKIMKMKKMRMNKKKRMQRIINKMELQKVNILLFIIN